MKTVTIPEGMNPFVVYCNGVKYVYSPGETVEVPDGVAIEIEEYRDAQNKKPGAVDAPFDSDCCDSGGGGGGGSTEPSYEVILPEQIIYEDSVGTGRTTLFNKAIGFIEGETYRITFNGEEYVLEAYVSLAEGQVPICGAGNAAFIGGEDTGEPFGVADIVSPQMTACGISWNTGEESITLKVEKLVITGQPDYLQNDPTAKDHIKNRPFYESMSELLPATEMTFVDGMYEQTEYTGGYFIEGETYIVDWNGTEYSCVAQRHETENVIGNVALATGTGDTGEPFVIIANASSGALVGLALDGSATATVKISANTVKKIEEKYLPQINSVVYIPVTDSGSSNSPEYSTTVTVGELKRAIDSGKFVVAKVRVTSSNPNTFSYCPLIQSDDSGLPFFLFFGNCSRELKFTVPDDFTLPDTLAGLDTIVYKVVKQ